MNLLCSAYKKIQDKGLISLSEALTKLSGLSSLSLNFGEWEIKFYGWNICRLNVKVVNEVRKYGASAIKGLYEQKEIKGNRLSIFSN